MHGKSPKGNVIESKNVLTQLIIIEKRLKFKF